MAGLKGEFNVLELVIAVSALLVSMYLFLSLEYGKTSSWHIIKQKIGIFDFLESLSNANILHEYVFGNKYNLPFFPISLTINPNEMRIACNCSNETQSLITSLFESEINGKKINSIMCLTNLESFNYCILNSNVLVIDYLPSDKYYEFLKRVINNNIGLLIYADASSNTFVNNNISLNITGIRKIGTTSGKFNISFSSSLSTYDEKIFKNFYPVYKNYYGISLYLVAPGLQSLPGCNLNRRGEIKIFNKSFVYPFVICNSTHVAIDLNRNNSFEDDEYKTMGSKLVFSEFQTNVTLKKITNASILISFDKYNLVFDDITKNVNIQPVDNEVTRKILTRSDGVPVLITNSTYYKVAWFQNFNDNISDDKKVALLSTLIWLSTRENRVPSHLSYFYFNITDSFFVYKLDLLV
ncbi:MAG: hypothetical protein QXJ14_01175 [Candidatus Aenigmatarchaeota archaeon]